MTILRGGSLAVEAPRPGVCVVYVTGLLDRALATRLAHVLEERLQPALRHVLVDLAGVDRMGPGSVPLLRTAIRVAARRRVSVHLTGAGALGAHLGVRDRQVLAEFAAFPTVPAALAVLAATHRPGHPRHPPGSR